jgi:hypothetical protein
MVNGACTPPGSAGETPKPGVSGAHKRQPAGKRAASGAADRELTGDWWK